MWADKHYGMAVTLCTIIATEMSTMTNLILHHSRAQLDPTRPPSMWIWELYGTTGTLIDWEFGHSILKNCRMAMALDTITLNYSPITVWSKTPSTEYMCLRKTTCICRAVVELVTSRLCLCLCVCELKGAFGGERIAAQLTTDGVRQGKGSPKRLH